MKYVLFVALAAVYLVAADATGKWTGTLTPSDSQPRPAHLVLKQDGVRLTGTAGPDESEQNEIQNGKAENGKLTFEVAAGEAVMKFALKQDGDEMTGDITRERGGQTQTAKITVKRVK